MLKNGQKSKHQKSIKKIDYIYGPMEPQKYH